MARPVTVRVALTAGQQADLQQRLGQRTLSPRLRRRLECIRLADLGWPATQIAAHPGVHQATVRRTVHRPAGPVEEGPAVALVRPAHGQAREGLPIPSSSTTAPSRSPTSAAVT